MMKAYLRSPAKIFNIVGKKNKIKKKTAYIKRSKKSTAE